MVTTAALYALLATQPIKAGSVYDFTLTNIDGKPTSLKKFKGKVILVVNVASKCGLTPQYASLEAAQKEYSKSGLVVLGFPANNFGNQEPGTEADIKEFCSTKYNVTFPMFGKISVKGDDIHPLYKWLVESTDGKEVEWNFGKFLIGRDGKTIVRFKPQQSVDSQPVKTAIEKLLSAKS